jgi:hypothetical protein
MMRLLEPQREERERYVPSPEHALTNGRPRSIHLSSHHTPGHKTPEADLQNALVRRRRHGDYPPERSPIHMRVETSAERQLLRQKSSAAWGSHSAVRGALHRQKSAVGGQRVRTQGRQESTVAKTAAAAAAREEKAQARGLDKTAHGMLDMVQGGDRGPCDCRRGHTSSVLSPTERGVAASMDNTGHVTPRVPGLEQSGVTAEDLNEAGILYDEERPLLHHAGLSPALLQAPACRVEWGRGGPRTRSSAGSDDGQGRTTGAEGQAPLRQVRGASSAHPASSPSEAFGAAKPKVRSDPLCMVGSALCSCGASWFDSVLPARKVIDNCGLLSPTFWQQCVFCELQV